MGTHNEPSLDLSHTSWVRSKPFPGGLGVQTAAPAGVALERRLGVRLCPFEPLSTTTYCGYLSRYPSCHLDEAKMDDAVVDLHNFPGITIIRQARNQNMGIAVIGFVLPDDLFSKRL